MRIVSFAICPSIFKRYFMIYNRYPGPLKKSMGYKVNLETKKTANSQGNTQQKEQ
jgi:hypothetical protein